MNMTHETLMHRRRLLLGAVANLICALGLFAAAATRSTTSSTKTMPVSDPGGIGNWIAYPGLTDNFTSRSLDSSKWSAADPGGVDDPSPYFNAAKVSLDGQYLSLAPNSAAYSAHATLYGSFEVKAQMASGNALSAFWLDGRTPALWTKICVFENGSDSYYRNEDRAFLHYSTDVEGSEIGTPFTWTAPVPLDTSFHTYGLDWEPEALSFYFDGNLIWRQTNAHWNQPMTLNFDCASIGATSAGAYKIDYVRVWKRASILGTVALQDFGGNASKAPLTVEMRTPGSSTVVETQQVIPDIDGSFMLASDLVGTYDVAVKASHWLRQVVRNVAISHDAPSGRLHFSLINGDVTGDNFINIADEAAVSAAWRSTPGSANWNSNADINGDGAVNLADWIVVSRNWRRTGD